MNLLALPALCALLALPAAALPPDPAEDPDSEHAVVSEEDDAAERAFAARRRAAALVAEIMPAEHILRQPFDETVAPRAWTNFLDSLDPQRIFFTAEDIASFEPARLRYADLVRAGDFSFARRVYDRFVERVADRTAFSSSILSNAFDFASSEDYRWRRRDVPWPADQAALDDLWTRRVKNALLAARIAWELREEGRSTNAVPAGASADSAAAADGAPAKDDGPSRTLDEAVEAARDDFRKANERLLEILRDSDEEYWASRFLDAAALAYDPHSNYMSPAANEDFDIDMTLSLQGIGATLQVDDGAAKIVDIVPGSPAELDPSPEHLVRGDRIIAVAQGDEDFVDIRHWPLYKSVRLIRGPKGTTVRLRVVPASDPDATKVVTLVRDEIKLEEQAAYSRVETVEDSDGTPRRLGYIKLPAFYASLRAPDGGAPRRASRDIARLLAGLNEEGVEGLVLDLRGNGGGSLPDAIAVAGLFLRTGPVVLVREARRRPIALPDTDPSVAFSRPMVVLVDRCSASASEIVAAALQDYGRAVIVGDVRTHGKGTVQTVRPLEDGALGAIKPTTALFFRISGGSTQIRGVASDIHLPSVFETYPDLGEDKLPGALPWTRIAPSAFRPVDSLSAVIPELRARSEARRATNAVWQARARLFERFAAFNANEVVSLNHEERLARAREDDVLQRRINALVSGEGEDLASLSPDAVPSDKDDEEKESPSARRRRKASEPRHPGDDPVLDESLNVLVDLVDLHGAPENLDANDAQFDFLRSFFR